MTLLVGSALGNAIGKGPQESQVAYSAQGGIHLWEPTSLAEANYWCCLESILGTVAPAARRSAVWVCTAFTQLHMSHRVMVRLAS